MNKKTQEQAIEELLCQPDKDILEKYEFRSIRPEEAD
jgi:hypothetical protein